MYSYLEEMCAKKKIKLTPHRKIIANVILKSKDHPDADEIHARAILINNKISLATVYRTLNILESNHIVRKLEVTGSKSRYESAYNDNEKNITHHHLINIKDGSIIEFYEPELEKINQRIAEKFGYKIINCKFELYGVSLMKSLSKKCKT